MDSGRNSVEMASAVPASNDQWKGKDAGLALLGFISKNREQLGDEAAAILSCRATLLHKHRECFNRYGAKSGTPSSHHGPSTCPSRDSFALS